MRIPVTPTPPNSARPNSTGTASTEAPRQATTSTGNQRAVLDSMALREGQSTLARVVEQVPATRTAAARLILEVSGQTLAVESSADLKPGTLIRIQREGDALRLLDTINVNSSSDLSRALAQKLPAQFDLQAGLKLIAALARALPNAPAGATGQASGEAGQIRSALQQILQLLPGQTQLQGSGNGTPAGATPDLTRATLRQWVLNSGAFTEALIAKPAADTPKLTDLKSNLLRLAVQLLKTDASTATGDLRRLQPAVSPEIVQQALQFPLSPITPQASSATDAMNAGALLRILAGMINRITVNQLHSQALSTAATPDGAPPPQTWLLELPWLNLQQEPRILQARIERHAQQEPDKEEKDPAERQAQWRLSLALDLDTLGPVYFDLALTRRTLSTRLWAEYETTWRLADARSAGLRQRLSALGLEITNLECLHGQPPQARTRLDRRLVDEKA